MKKLLRFSARLFILALALIAGSSGQVAAQEMESGYYYITRVGSNGLYLSYPGEDDAEPWRMKESTYLSNPVPNQADLPYIFKITKLDNGYFQFQNMASKEYVGRWGGSSRGAGLGLVETPRSYALVWNDMVYGYNWSKIGSSTGIRRGYW